METEEEVVLFRHFSHEHPLECTNYSSSSSQKITCHGCNLNLLSGKDYYNCKICQFSLHQVCFNMPKNIQHPADQNHNLTLLATPSTAKSNSKCKACAQNVTGFYYFCAKCGHHYHLLCSLLPLSLSIPSHSHTLNLEFSPPYEFECDLCNKPGYSTGWLYRCELCDFDVHLACAFSNQKAHPIPHQQPVSLADIMSPRSHKNASIDDELMQLLAQGVAAGTGEGGFVDSIRNGCRIKKDTAGTSSCARKLSQPSTPHSDDLSTMSSYQFSDAYFSIDIARTCEDDDDNDNMNQLASEEASSYETRDGLESKKRNSNGYVIMPNKQGSDPCFKGPENKQNKGAISIGIDARVWQELGQENRKRKGNGFRDGSDIKDQNAESESESESARLRYCSCWSRLFVCCYYLRSTSY